MFRPRLVETLVIVCFMVLTLMCDVVIINYQLFFIREILFRKKRKAKNTFFCTFFGEKWEMKGNFFPANN